MALVGFYQPKSPIQDLTAEEFKETMDIALGGNFCKSQRPRVSWNLGTNRNYKRRLPSNYSLPY